jgi:hypothetical protein
MLGRSLRLGPVFGHDTKLLAYQTWPAGQPPARTRWIQANGAGAASEAPRGQAGATSAWNDAGPPTSGQQTMIVANPGPPAGAARTRPPSNNPAAPRNKLVLN